ncbi:MAG: glycine cleavage T C-terminal barrel domain-containing protein [Ignavibacteriaceae bacterium]
MIDFEEKSLPLLELYEELGYKSETQNEKKIFKKFSSIEEELNSIYEGVAVKDVSSRGVIELRGKDVLDFINRISTNETGNLAKENIIDTIFTTEKGRIIDLTTLLNFDDFQILICSPENQHKVVMWIGKYIITDDVKQTNINNKYVMLEVLGPQADSFMSWVSGNIVNDIQPNTFKIINAEGKIFFLVKMLNKDGKKKFLIIADPAHATELVKYMVSNKGPFNFNLIGEDAYNIYRVEEGIPIAPNELNDNYNPHEAKLLDAVSFTKGCYIGQEVIARLETYEKVQKYLMGIIFEDEADPADNYLLFDDEGKEAGKITSIVNSYRVKKYIGLTYVKKSFAQEGTKLIAKTGSGKVVNVEVKNLPFKR